jgi:hypothetical protein
LRPKDLAQGADLDLKVVLFHHEPRPDQLEQLVFGDQSFAPLDQGEQDIQRPCAQRHRLPVAEQLPGRRIQLEPAKAVRGGHFVHSNVRHEQNYVLLAKGPLLARERRGSLRPIRRVAC